MKQLNLCDIPIKEFKKTRKKLYTIKAVFVDMSKKMGPELSDIIRLAKKEGLRYKVSTVKVHKEGGVFKVINYLEGAVYDICDPDSPLSPDTKILLLGTVNELWGVPIKKILTQYTKPDGSPLSVSDFKANRPITIQSKPSNLCYAAYIPKNTLVRVDTAWGDTLLANRPGVPHGRGDFLVCNADEMGNPALNDTWVVNGNVFSTTYAMNSFSNLNK